jgi:hypothetical protein
VAENLRLTCESLHKVASTLDARARALESCNRGLHDHWCMSESLKGSKVRRSSFTDLEAEGSRDPRDLPFETMT